MATSEHFRPTQDQFLSYDYFEFSELITCEIQYKGIRKMKTYMACQIDPCRSNCQLAQASNPSFSSILFSHRPAANISGTMLGNTP